MADYKKTLNLPRTSFPMRANLTQNEPKMLAFWEKNNAYQTMVAANREEERFVLHDGPPYANGHIHLGTAMNKVLKDFIVKSRNLSGRRAEYVPGWDCHGLPIEHKVSQELKDKGKTDLPLVTVRRICRDYAAKFLDIQRKEFKRLGVFGTWDTPYRTMDPSYEAATARELGRFMALGSVVRGKKPIHWCCSCETALAEAEVEYSDHTSPSIYVRFPLNDPRLKEVFARAEPGKAWVVIWTTTPWTLPGNMAVAVHPEFTYQLVQARGEHYVLARDLVAQCAAVFDWEDYEVLGEASGRELEGLTARHPFIDRASPIVLAPYVTLEAGTGCVHTAPGHGREDYETGLKYGLDILSPLDDQGRFLENVARFAGLNVFEANARVIQVLQDEGHLLAGQRLTHSYPHCWRCKKPVIFRATTQWFISMEKNGLRTKALAAIRDQVEWIPAWGRERIHSMIENRPDWCISRQRTWGVPIIALLCQGCDHAYTDSKWVFEIVERFQDHPRGCDYWFEAEVSELAPPGLACPECGGTSWKKEDDILDVWFDSGTSFAAVVEQRPECSFPADLYLEGTDQHRGWFHSSLLASVGTRERAPYRSVLTHGYVVDGEGRKMSKSLGNVIAPQEIIETHGAEILRLWVSAVNYQEDVRISDEILGRLVDAYRRIRNTCRFLLGNIDGFGPGDVTPFADMQPLDRYLLHRVARAH
ncbi:MAG: isoleucine--tRNA ligase, partial [Desulfohalobiaceae bacterium]